MKFICCFYPFGPPAAAAAATDPIPNPPAVRPSFLLFFTAVSVAVVVAVRGAPLPFLPVEAEEEVEVENANTLLTPLPSPSLFSPSPFPFPLWLRRHSAPLSPIQPSSVSPPFSPPPSTPFILCDPESKKDFHPLAESFLELLFHFSPYCMENVSPRPLL